MSFWNFWSSKKPTEIPTSFDVRDKNEIHKSCAWILNQTHTQTMGTGYKSAVANYEIPFKQCVANKKANLGFGKDYYNAIDNKAKEIVMNPQNAVGGLYGGFRHKMFDALKRGDDSGKSIAGRVASIQREIIENGPVTLGFTVPMVGCMKFLLISVLHFLMFKITEFSVF